MAQLVVSSGRSAVHLLTRDEAPRIAANIAKLPEAADQAPAVTDPGCDSTV